VSIIAEVKKWSNTVKQRDNYICKKCNIKYCKMVAHHINSWANFPEKRFILENGVALCKPCHKKLHNSYGNNCTKKDFIKFLENKKEIKTNKPLKTGSICNDNGLIGQKFNSWTVLNKFRIDKTYYCTCQCDCGNIGTPSLNNLKINNSTNCGCVHKNKLKLQTGTANPAYKHGFAKRGKITKEYKIWADIKTRCLNVNSKVFEHYGGRGITICNRWKNSFENFLKDMGFAPPKYEIERINVNGNYEPNNCKWATRQEQCSNRRQNKFITFNDITKTYTQWEKELGLKPTTISQRKRYGWCDEKCLTSIRSKK